MTAVHDHEIARPSVRHNHVQPMGGHRIRTMRGVDAGERATTPLTSTAAAAPHQGMAAAPALVAPPLSSREIEVMRAWLLTDSKREAASRLFITEATVSTHLTRIKAKYAAVGRPARTKVALFVRAVQDGHTTVDEH